MENVLNIISTVGFPIACCVALGYFCFMLIKKQNETTEKREKQHAEEVAELRKIIQANTNVINNLNSNILLLLEHVRGVDDESKL